MRKIVFLFAFVLTNLLFIVNAQNKTGKVSIAVGLAAIKETDLKTDLYNMAGDHFRGREAGTNDELKGAVWWAEEVRKAGLLPAGDDGTYFQFFSLQRNRIATNSTVSISGHPLLLWTDVLAAQITPVNLSVPIVFAASGDKATLDAASVKGKAVAILASPQGLNLQVSLAERRYPTLLLNKFRDDLIGRGAVAVIFIADTLGEKSWPQVVPALSRGLYDIAGGPNAFPVARIPVFWLHGKEAALVKTDSATLNATINIEHFEYPSVNVVAKVAGTDPVLSKEYILFSGHHDHDGVRLAYGTDSIYNGADDNGSVSVAVLAIARAFKKQPGRRSALFIWHGAEERGLLGSRWFAAHPTVAFDAIAAVLNGDMIGRNNPDSAALLGVQPPHRNSADLVAMGLEANKEGPAFKLDTLWDKTTHVEGWYFRSDHLPYARLGIPAIYFTTLLHEDYHTPMDEPNRIKYAKLKKMADWMYLTGWKAANADKRPGKEPGFKLER